ncbi:hypothetical protein [Nitrosomonas marina]|uniref:Cobalamin ABC transporter n=1 Tax=Nitrosomonas marina TaxID=917 RepID=A0A1H8IRC6_9PROT|nr:hypothetical protein [Nitrosomonas marina]SEN70228.1 hypothetical protein SAMN05216325_1375 [Nitrosomonas marina]
MLALATRNQIIIGVLLALLMIVTRGHHFASLQNLPSASWAVFFLAGVYLRSAWLLPGFFTFAWILDFAGYTWGGASGFCLTPAYFFLLPAYASLWLAGRWYANQHGFSWRTFLPLSLSLIVSTLVCRMFSSGGFYLFSGHFEEKTLVEFSERFMKHLPLFFEAFVFYVAIAVAIHAACVLIPSNKRHTTAG